MVRFNTAVWAGIVPKLVDGTTKVTVDDLDVVEGAASHSVEPGGDTQMLLPTIDPRLSQFVWMVGFHESS